jgi:flagellar L-ring protein precursor FlgH
MRTTVLAIIVTLLAAEACAQDAFWQNAKVGESSFTTTHATPTRTFKKYDIITVLIVEAASGSGEGTLERNKEVAKKFTINDWARLTKRNGGYTLRPALRDGTTTYQPSFDIEYESEDDREGIIDRADTLQARVAAVVMDVKPNGNLVIQAKSLTKLNKEVRNITLTGMVRSEDVRPDNTVPSYCIAMAEIKYETSGPASDGARRGWLTSIFDFINPF